MARAYGQHPADLLGIDRDQEPEVWLLVGAASFAAGLKRLAPRARKVMGTLDVGGV